MAGGWARNGAVQEQIEASVNDELALLKARRAPVGESAEFCAQCEEPIPQARREALPGVKFVLRVCVPATGRTKRAAGLTAAAQRTVSSNSLAACAARCLFARRAAPRG